MMGLQATASKRKLDDDIASPHASPQPAKQGRLDEAAVGVAPQLHPSTLECSRLSTTMLHRDAPVNLHPQIPMTNLECSRLSTVALHRDCGRIEMTKSVDDWRLTSVMATTIQEDEESDDSEDEDEEEERGGKYLPAGRGYQCVRYHGDHYLDPKSTGYYGTNVDQGGYSGSTPIQYTRQQPHYPTQRSTQYWAGEYYGQESQPPQQTIRCDENGKSYLDLGSSSRYGAEVKCCDGSRTSWCSRGGCYRQRRLAVLNISMCKLGRYRQFPDPSLHRSVLICNTLRYIEREMEQEGFFFNNSTPVAPPPPAPHPVPEMDQGYHGSHFAPEVANYPTPPEVPLPSYEQNLRDLSVSGRATPFPQPTYDTDSGVGDDLESARGINWGSVLSLSSQSDLDPLNNNELFPSSPSSSLGLDTALDVDLSHDLDNFLPGWKLTPLSADDIIKSVPSAEVSSRQSEGELDSIMHVLVGT